MPHPDETLLRRMYDAINSRDYSSVMNCFAANAIWHGAGLEVTGPASIAELVRRLDTASGGTLHIDVHDVLANDVHVVVLQTTRAERGDRVLQDRVVYVFHVGRGRITHAWFTGDPRVQDEFWSD